MIRLLILSLITACLLYSCSQNLEAGYTLDEAYSEQETAPFISESKRILEANKNSPESAISNSIASMPLTLSERKIIRNADISMEVKNIKSSLFQIEMSVENKGGYVAGLNMQKMPRQITTDLVLKVPTKELKNLLLEVDKEALNVDYRKIKSQDVTEEMVDITARLKTKKEVHNRYTNILRHQAKSIEDVIYAEEQIRKLTEEIEAKEGRLAYLSHQTSLSTIKIKMYQKTALEDIPILTASTPSFFTTFIENASMGWDTVLIFVLEFVKLWPLWLILIVFGIQRKKIWRRFRT